MINPDIQDIYFECPRCKERVHIAYTSAETRKYNEEMQSARTALMQDKNNEKLFIKVRDMMDQYKKMMDKLNSKGADNNA